MATGAPPQAVEWTARGFLEAVGGKVGSDRQGLVHHSDRSSRYLSIRGAERLAEAGVELSVRSRGDAYDAAGTFLAALKTTRSVATVLQGFRRRRVRRPSMAELVPRSPPAGAERQLQPAENEAAYWTVRACGDTDRLKQLRLS